MKMVRWLHSSRLRLLSDVRMNLTYAPKYWTCT
jgi:hypothetical protein